MRYGSLFSGYGGLDRAVEAVFGAKAAWHSEIEPAACTVLEARWPGVPNLGDVSKVDWSTVERPEIMCGGFPCTDLSAAGLMARAEARNALGIVVGVRARDQGPTAGTGGDRECPRTTQHGGKPSRSSAGMVHGVSG